MKLSGRSHYTIQPKHETYFICHGSASHCTNSNTIDWIWSYFQISMNNIPQPLFKEQPPSPRIWSNFHISINNIPCRALLNPKNDLSSPYMFSDQWLFMSCNIVISSQPHFYFTFYMLMDVHMYMYACMSYYYWTNMVCFALGCHISFFFVQTLTSLRVICAQWDWQT